MIGKLGKRVHLCYRHFFSHNPRPRQSYGLTFSGYLLPSSCVKQLDNGLRSYVGIQISIYYCENTQQTFLISVTEYLDQFLLQYNSSFSGAITLACVAIRTAVTFGEQIKRGHQWWLLSPLSTLVCLPLHQDTTGYLNYLRLFQNKLWLGWGLVQ